MGVISRRPNRSYRRRPTWWTRYSSRCETLKNNNTQTDSSNPLRPLLSTQYYKALSIRVALIGLEVWTGRDMIGVSDNPHGTLAAFLSWRGKQLRSLPNDNAQLITSVLLTPRPPSPASESRPRPTAHIPLPITHVLHHLQLCPHRWRFCVSRGRSFRGTIIGMAHLKAMCSDYQSGGVNTVRDERKLMGTPPPPPLVLKWFLKRLCGSTKNRHLLKNHFFHLKHLYRFFEELSKEMVL